jgi:hypothetical protein
VLVPISLVWVLLVAAIKTARAQWTTRDLIIALIIVGVVGVLLSALWPAKADASDQGELDDAMALGGIDTTGTFPVPRLEDLLAERAPSPVAVGALSGGASAPAATALEQAPDGPPVDAVHADLGTFGQDSPDNSGPEGTDRA